MFCPYCGKKVGEDFVFCASCGKRLPVQEPDWESAKKSNPQTPTNKVQRADPPEPKGNNKLDCEFRKLVAKMPSEALAHFKTVDPTVWKVAKTGREDASALLHHGWSGPYCVTICGVKYEAFAKTDRLAASQVRFLHDWAGGVKRALKRQALRMELEGGGEQAHSLLRYVLYAITLIGIVSAVYGLSIRWGGSWGMW